VSRIRLLAALSLAPLLVIACGGGGDADDGETPTATSTASTVEPGSTPVTPVAVDDRGYLAVICSGLEEYTAAIIREQTVEGIQEVVVAYIDSLQSVIPPEDLAGFHAAFIAYLSEAVESPTDLLATPRPLPPDDVRERLADLENDVPECRDARFFSEREEDE
jgi:hypothetical protein